MSRTSSALARIALTGVLAACGSTAALAQSGEVNVYSYREQKLIQPLFDEFTKDTGIKVNVVSANSGLEQRIATEGANSPADVLLTVDVARLQDAVNAGITQPIKSTVLEKAIPAQYHGADGMWYGISMRARVVYASKDRVKQDAITYEELADPKWKGKICIRSGQHMYNNALFAAYIVKHGEAKAEEWLKGLKANLAQKPSGGDREVARDIASGKCDIGLGNTYYWALMNDKETDKKAWAEATKRDPADLPGRRHTCEPLGRRAGEERAEQGQRDEADRMAGRRKSAAHLRRPELRISAAGRDQDQSDDRGLRQAQRPTRCRSPRSRSRKRPPPRSWTRSVSTIDRLTLSTASAAQPVPSLFRK